MRLIPTVEQSELRSTLRAVLAKECPTELVREWKELGGESFPDKLWQALTEVGVFGLTVPEEHGGAGASLNELGIFYSEAGRVLCPSLVYSTLAFGLALQRLGSAEQCARYLPELAEGRLRAGVSAWDAANAGDVRPTLTAVRAEGGWALSGVLPFVENADLAQVLLSTATTLAYAEPSQVLGVLLEPGGPGWTSTPQRTMAGEWQSRVELDACFVPDERVLTGVQLSDVRAVANTVTALACMEMAGGGAAVLERTVEYVRGREQFGRPIGSFQAVQHIVADIHIALEAARLTAASAVWWLAKGEAAGRNVAIAKMHASEAYKWATLNAHQVHGGIGYVRETDLHLFSERAKVSEIRGGTADVAASWLEEEIGLGC